jgi:hypothetical protein
MLQTKTSIDQLTTEILFYKRHATTSILEIGKRLIEVREQFTDEEIKKGEWGKWLKEKVDFAQDTATKLIRIAKEFSGSEPELTLGTGKLFKLLAIPIDERGEFINNNHILPSGESKNVNEMTKMEFQNLVIAHNKAKKELSDTFIKEKEILESQLQEALDKPAEIIDNTDYDAVDKLEHKLSLKDKDVEKLKRDKELLERKVKLNEKEVKEFNDLKSQIEFLNEEKESISRQIKSATELSGLSLEIDNLLKTKLSPIRYSRTLERMDSEVAIQNLNDIINSVQSWCNDMRKYLPNENQIIDAEVVR